MEKKLNCLIPPVPDPKMEVMIRRLILSLITALLLGGACFFYNSGSLRLTRPEPGIWAAASAAEKAEGYYKIPVLIFHNVDGAGRYSITSEEFRDVLEEIKRQKIRIISMRDLIQMAETGSWPETPSAVLTFDDDYENIVKTAAPLLREYRLPASFYAYISNISSDEKQGFTYEDLNRLLSEGFEVENHSWSHGVFQKPYAGESAAHYESRLDREVRLSREVLESRLIRKVYTFALPMGYKSPALLDRLKNEGYELVLLADGGIQDLREGYDGTFDRATIMTIPGISPARQLKRLMEKARSD